MWHRWEPRNLDPSPSSALAGSVTQARPVIPGSTHSPGGGGVCLPAGIGQTKRRRAGSSRLSLRVIVTGGMGHRHLLTSSSDEKYQRKSWACEQEVTVPGQGTGPGSSSVPGGGIVQEAVDE